MIEKRIDPILILTYKMPNFHPIKSVPDKKSRNAQPVKIMLRKLPYFGYLQSAGIFFAATIDDFLSIVVH